MYPTCRGWLQDDRVSPELRFYYSIYLLYQAGSTGGYFRSIHISSATV